MPNDTSGNWTGLTIYRSVNSPPGNTSFYPLPNATNLPLGSTTVTDNTSDAALIASGAPVLSMNGSHIGNPTADVTTDVNGQPVAGNLRGTYQYYVTFYNSQTNMESRPQLMPTASPSLDNEQVTLSNLPAPNSGTWTSERIYRSTNDQAGDTNCYQVADIPIATATTNGYTYTDNASDASIRASGQVMSFDGPPVSGTTLLSNVVEYNSSTGSYQQVFPTTGTLAFTGTKGGNSLDHARLDRHERLDPQGSGEFSARFSRHPATAGQRCEQPDSGRSTFRPVRGREHHDRWPNQDRGERRHPRSHQPSVFRRCN